MKLKILQIINNLGSGGAEKLISDFVPLIAQRGHCIEILLLQKQGSIYIDELQKQGICVTSLSESNLFSISHIWKIRKFIKKGNFDVVHVHIFPALYFVAVAALFGIGKSKLCFTEHNTTNRRMENTFFRVIDKWIYSFYETIICITDEVRNNIQRHLENKKLQYITVLNGVNLSNFAHPIQLKKESLYDNYTKEDRIITMVARFSEQKDQGTLIKSLQYLSANIHLLLVGEGPLKKKNEDLVSELNLSDRIHFLGLRKDIPDILRLSDIGVLSSNWEGMPLSGIEVMAAGIPFIGADVPGIKELIIPHPQAGLLFSKGNSKELAYQINYLLENPALYGERAIACKKQSQEYSIEKMVRGYLTVYKKMLNENDQTQNI